MSYPFSRALMFVNISQDSEWAGADGMHPVFVGEETNPDRVREKCRSQNIRLHGITHGSSSSWREGEGSEGSWLPRDVAVVGEGRHQRAVGCVSLSPKGRGESKKKQTAQAWNLIRSQIASGD